MNGCASNANINIILWPMGTLSWKASTSFSFCLSVPYGSFLKEKKMLFFKKRHHIGRTVVQNGKQEAINVVSYCENGRKA